MNRLDDTGDTSGPGDAVWEDAVGRELERRVRDLHEAPLSLSDVGDAARSVQRRRRGVVAGAVLATAAVVTPVALLATTDGEGGGDPVVARDVAAPLYLEDDELVRSDGTRVELDERYREATTLGDQLLATRYDDRGAGTTDVLGEDGEVLDSFDARQPPVANAAHTAVTWLDPDGRLLVRPADDAGDGDDGVDGSESDDVVLADRLPPGTTIAALTGSPVCGEDDRDACRAWVYVPAAVEPLDDPLVIASGGGPAGPGPGVPGAVRFQDATEERVATLTDIEDLSTFGGVYDLAAETYLFETCERQTLDLSPDGRLVVLGPSYFDGIGPSEITVADAATGAVVAEVTPSDRDGFVSGWAWRADGSLLVRLYEDDLHSIVRVSADGGRETVAGPVEAAFDRTPFVLVQAP